MQFQIVAKPSVLCHHLPPFGEHTRATIVPLAKLFFVYFARKVGCKNYLTMLWLFSISKLNPGAFQADCCTVAAVHTTSWACIASKRAEWAAAS